MKTMVQSFAFLAVLFGFANGCGPGKGGLTGKVTLDGKAITKGQVSLQAGNGQIYAGDIGEDGTYLINGIPSGTVKVAVTSIDEAVTEYFRALAKAGKREGVAPKAPPKAMFAIPEKYGDFNTSDLTTVVKSGAPTTYNIEIPSK